MKLQTALSMAGLAGLTLLAGTPVHAQTNVTFLLTLMPTNPIPFTPGIDQNIPIFGNIFNNFAGQDATLGIIETTSGFPLPPDILPDFLPYLLTEAGHVLGPLQNTGFNPVATLFVPASHSAGVPINLSLTVHATLSPAQGGVPEPGSLALLVSGTIGSSLFLARRRRK